MLISLGIMHPASGREILLSRGVRTRREPIVVDYRTQRMRARGEERPSKGYSVFVGTEQATKRKVFSAPPRKPHIRHPTARRPVTGAHV